MTFLPSDLNTLNVIQTGKKTEPFRKFDLSHSVMPSIVQKLHCRMSLIRSGICMVVSVTLLCILPLQSSAYQGSDNVNERAHAVDSLQKQLLKPLNDSARVLTLSHLARHLAFIKPAEALSHAQEAIRIGESKGLGIRVNRENFITIGIIHVYIASYSEAIPYFLKALQITRKLKDKQEEFILNNIGASYSCLKQYEQAKKYYLEALNVKRSRHIQNTVSDYSNLGSIYAEQGRPREALILYKKALKQDSSANPLLGNIGEAYEDLGQLHLAEYYFKKSEQSRHKNVHSLIASCNNLGRLYIRKKQFSDAARYLYKAKDLALLSGVHIDLDDTYEKLALMYEAQKNFAQANIYRKRLEALKDSTYEEQIALQTAVMHAKYESDQKDNQIQSLVQQKEIVEAHAERQHVIRNFIITGVLLFLLLSLILARNILLKQRVRNKMLNEEKVRMQLKKEKAENDLVKLLNENAEAKYEILKSKTDPHFLFNSLSTLSSIIVKDKKDIALEFVDRFSEYYRLILEKADTKYISIKEELQLVDSFFYLHQVRFPGNIIVNVNIPEGLDHGSVPTFAIQMTVENALKYNIVADNKKMYIGITIEKQYVVIRNTMQIKRSEDPSTYSGQKNITARYAMLSDSTPVFEETGTEYIVRLPLLVHETEHGKNEIMA